MQTYEEQSGEVYTVERVIGHMRTALLTPFYLFVSFQMSMEKRELTHWF